MTAFSCPAQLGRLLAETTLTSVNLCAAMPLLNVSNLNHSFGQHGVIHDLSFQLLKGSIGCLLGPSGCGKTTVLRCIAGFEQPNSGQIVVAGQTVSSPQTFIPPEKRKIGMVFQDYALFPHLNVSENIAFGLTNKTDTEKRSRVHEMLDLVGLVSHAKKFPHELSGGQQQRISLARALAPEPELLLLDEPFSNLDTDLRERLSLEVREILKSSGTTAILVTHDQHEAFAMSDEIGVMHQGVIQQWDSAYNLYHRPANRFVADFIGQGSFLAGKVLDTQHVRISLGTLFSDIPVDCCPPSDLDAECIVDVLLRPDDVIHDDASLMTACVVSKMFRGAEFLYTLELASGERIYSLVPSHHNHAIGEQIGIRLAVDHVVAFKPSIP